MGTVTVLIALFYGYGYGDPLTVIVLAFFRTELYRTASNYNTLRGSTGEGRGKTGPREVGRGSRE